MRRASLLPWLYIAPALVFLGLFLIYPSLDTIRLSLMDARSQRFVGLDNYIYAFTTREMLISFRNNFVLWLPFATSFTVAGGLIIAVLVDRVRYEPLAKAAIFLPQAISFVGAGVIWRFVYDHRPQLGLLNAILTGISDTSPRGWLSNPRYATFALIVVFIWMWTGFAMIIFSAAIKGIPREIIEAAQSDGANEWQIFWYVRVPMIQSTIGVVTTTMIIFVLKVFDLVYVMTAGRYETNVIANQMYRELFVNRQNGRAAAISVVLLVTIVPVMLVNIQRFREQEALR
ncbi:MAG: carbohydrate ABC transporter permease [Anaerolineae bacterium]|jgi:alpha-glucoside transport system permease protein